MLFLQNQNQDGEKSKVRLAIRFFRDIKVGIYSY